MRPCACLVMLAFMLSLAPITSRAEPDELERLRAENAALRGQVQTLEHENTALRALADVRANEQEPLVIPVPPDATTQTPSGLRTRAIRLDVTRGSRAFHELTVVRREDGSVTGTIAARLSGGIYRHAETVRLVIDETEYACPIVDHDIRRITGGGMKRRVRHDNERITFTLPAAAVGALVEASAVQGVVARTHFDVPPDGIVALRVLASAADPE